MSISRREFLGYAAASVVLGGVRRVPLGTRTSHNQGFVILREQCTIPESLSGYEAALATLNRGKRLVVVVPAALALPPTVMRALRDYLDDGATILLESGAAYIGQSSRETHEFAEFANHRAMLYEEFAICVESPRSLWPAHGIPYVQYTWPHAAMVRDFSRVVPLAPQQGEIIARVDDLPVALRRTYRSGMLIFLGSPLGPALLFGDSEARRWMLDVFAPNSR